MYLNVSNMKRVVLKIRYTKYIYTYVLYTYVYVYVYHEDLYLDEFYAVALITK